LGEGLGGILPTKGLSRSRIKSESDGIEVVTGVSGKVGALGKVLAKQSIRVLVSAALPRAVRIAEEDVES
jgi:hypothetical protein